MNENPTVFTDVTAKVEIPEDGTLTRVVFSDDKIRIVVFAFDVGQELTDHTASVPAVVQVLSGRITLTLDGDPIELAPGGWVHMPANLPHAVTALEPTIMLLTMLRG